MAKAQTASKAPTTDEKIASLEQTIASLAATVQEFARRADHRFALMETTSSPLVDKVSKLADAMDTKLQLGNRQQRMARRSAEYVIQQSEVEVALMQGRPTDLMYRCRISTEPRSEIFVAAMDDIHAEDVFKRFYKIRGFIDPNVRVIVERVDGEITPEMLPPRQAKALATIEAQKEILAEVNLRVS